MRGKMENLEAAVASFALPGLWGGLATSTGMADGAGMGSGFWRKSRWDVVLTPEAVVQIDAV